MRYFIFKGFIQFYAIISVCGFVNTGTKLVNTPIPTQEPVASGADFSLATKRPPAPCKSLTMARCRLSIPTMESFSATSEGAQAEDARPGLSLGTVASAIPPDTRPGRPAARGALTAQAATVLASRLARRKCGLLAELRAALGRGEETLYGPRPAPPSSADSSGGPFVFLTYHLES